MRKNSGNTKVIGIIVIGIILIIAGILGYFMYDSIQYSVLAQEISKINNEKRVDLDIKSKGKYEDLERGIKEYANEYYSNINKLKELYSKDELKNMLSIQNIKNDGPNFDTTKTTITNFVSEQNNIKEKLQNMTSEEYLNKKVEEYSLDAKKRGLFLSTLDLKEDANKIIGIIDSYLKYVNSIDSVINFLKENKDNWSIKDDKIMFKNVELLNNYNSLISTQKDVQIELKNKLSNNKV